MRRGGAKPEECPDPAGGGVRYTRAPSLRLIPRLPGSFPGLEGAPLPSRQLLQGPLGAHLRARDPLRGPGTEWGHPKAPLSIGVR